MERHIDGGKGLYLTSEDLQAAFDTTNRSKLWKCLKQLKQLGIVQKLIEEIKCVCRIPFEVVVINGTTLSRSENNKGISRKTASLCFLVLFCF